MSFAEAAAKAALQWTRSEDGNSVRAEVDGVTFIVRIAAVR